MDETWYTDVTSQEDDKKVIRSGGHRARFDKYGYLGPFNQKPRAAQN